MQNIFHMPYTERRWTSKTLKQDCVSWHTANGNIMNSHNKEEGLGGGSVGMMGSSSPRWESSPENKNGVYAEQALQAWN